jgi:hypothetical protein
MPTQSDRSVTIRMGEALQLRLDIDAIENRRTPAESLRALLCDALRDQPFNLTQCWSTHRSRVTHLYVPGHGTGDSALCGGRVRRQPAARHLRGPGVRPVCDAPRAHGEALIGVTAATSMLAG